VRAMVNIAMPNISMAGARCARSRGGGIAGKMTGKTGATISHVRRRVTDHR
jgi:hypothetical protein